MTRAQSTYRLTMVFLYATIALTVGTLFFARLAVHRERLDLGNMVYGTAHKPYAYRVLVPGIVRAVVVVSDVAFSRGGVARTDNPVARLGARVLRDIGAQDQAERLSYEYGIFFILTILCLLGFALLLRALTRLSYPEYPRFVSDFAPLLGVAVIPLVFFRQSNLVYDPMTLFLFTLCVYLIARRSHLAYVVAFPLAVLNKETAIFLPFIFLLRETGLSTRGKLGALAAFQLGLFAVVRLWLAYALRERPGASVELHLDYNLTLLRDLGFYVKTLAAVVPLTVLVAYNWKAKPAFLRRSLLLTVVPLLALSVFLAVLGEMRDFYEAYPFVFLLAIPTVTEVFEVSGS